MISRSRSDGGVGPHASADRSHTPVGRPRLPRRRFTMSRRRRTSHPPKRPEHYKTAPQRIGLTEARRLGNDSSAMRRVAWAIRPLWLLLVLLGLLVVAGLLVWAALVEPPWLLDTTGLSGAEAAKARNDFRGAMLTGLVGLAVLAVAGVGAL